MNEQLLNKEYKYVVGVSGGCDSMYLLDYLYQNEYKIYVVHINYNYRHDSYEDYKLVKEYCNKRNIQLFYKECKPDDHKGNFQDYARKVRYEYYKEIYQLFNCQGVLLGHHFDDYIENVYMQLSHHNTYYYLGIKDINTVYEMNIIRPMLLLSKDYIRSYCLINQIPYRDDYTNFETDFERDYVRNKILNDYSIEDKHKLYHKAYLHNQRIDKLIKEIEPDYIEYNNKGYISYTKIKNNINIFLYSILKDKLDPRLISTSLIEEIKKQINSNKPNIEMNLPVNYLFIKEYDNIYIINKQEVNNYNYIFNEYKEFSCPYFSLSLKGHINEGLELSKEDYPIMIRNFKNGDSIKTVYGTKKVSRLFIDNKIPLNLRKRWPIVLNNRHEIILIPHLAKNIDYLSTNCNLFVLK